MSLSIHQLWSVYLRRDISRAISAAFAVTSLVVTGLTPTQVDAAPKAIAVERYFCKTAEIYHDVHRYRTSLADTSGGKGFNDCTLEDVLGWCFSEPVAGSKPFTLRNSSISRADETSSTTLCHTADSKGGDGSGNIVGIVGVFRAWAEGDGEAHWTTYNGSIVRQRKRAAIDFVYSKKSSGEWASLVGNDAWQTVRPLPSLYRNKKDTEDALAAAAAKLTDIEVTEATISIKEMTFVDRTEHTFVARGCVKNAGAHPLSIQVSMLAGASGVPVEQFNSQIASNVAPGATQCTTANIPEAYVAQNCTALLVKGQPYNSGITDTDASDNAKSNGKCRTEKVTMHRKDTPVAQIPAPGAVAKQTEPIAAIQPKLPAPAIALQGKWTWQLPALGGSSRIFKFTSITMKAALTDNTGKPWNMSTLAPKGVTRLEIATRPHSSFSVKPAYGPSEKVFMTATALISGTTWNAFLSGCNDYKIRVDTDDGATQTADVSATIAASDWIEFTAGTTCK
ncbi:MAG: hypothetical protein EAZ30_14905 [Betaproteobacteria bacterium]|nr:MAG: hypothetical protein EAZ30_14905 [Betaproteobacteria bacterium]